MQINTLEGLAAPALTQIVVSGKHHLTLHSLLPLAACAALRRISVTWSSASPRPQRSRTTASQLLHAFSALTALTDLDLRGSSGPLRARRDRLGALALLLEKIPEAVGGRQRHLCAGPRPTGPPLLQLSMRGCEALRDRDLAALATSPLADTLTYLTLSGCAKITGRGFDSVASLQALRRLDLSQ